MENKAPDKFQPNGHFSLPNLFKVYFIFNLSIKTFFLIAFNLI